MINYKLNNGTTMPAVGLGTYLISPEDAEVSVREGLKMGYRLIDTANAYMNERAVGRGIKASGVKREDIYVSTKIWATEYLNDNIVDETLERLGLEYIDLLYIHQPSKNYMHAYRNIEKAVKEGKVKSIGISNCEGKYILDILEHCEIKPQVMQAEAHPYFTQDELRTVLDENGIILQSWYPLGHGDSKLMNEEVFTTLAKKYNKTPAQIILRWHIEMGFCVIPGSKNVDHIKDNLDIINFSLTQEDMDLIAKVNKNERYYIRTEEMLNFFSTMGLKYEEK